MSEMEKDTIVIWLYNYTDLDLISLLKSEEINLPKLTKAVIKMYAAGKKGFIKLPPIKNPFSVKEAIHRKYNYMIRLYDSKDKDCMEVLSQIRKDYRLSFIKNLLRSYLLGGFTDFYFCREEDGLSHHQMMESGSVPVYDLSTVYEGIGFHTTDKDLKKDITFKPSFVTADGKTDQKVQSDLEDAVKNDPSDADKPKKKRRGRKSGAVEKPSIVSDAEKKPAAVSEEVNKSDENADINAVESAPVIDLFGEEESMGIETDKKLTEEQEKKIEDMFSNMDDDY